MEEDQPDFTSAQRDFFETIPDLLAKRYSKPRDDISVDLNIFEEKYDELIPDRFGMDSGYQESRGMSKTNSSTSLMSRSKPKSSVKQQAASSCNSFNSVCKPANADSRLEKLDNLCNIIAKGGNYGRELIDMLLKQLKEGSQLIYQLFITDKLEENRLYPFIEINSNNTPVIQFIYKSDHSDNTILDDLNLTPDLYRYSDHIVKCIQQSINIEKPVRPQAKPQSARQLQNQNRPRSAAYSNNIRSSTPIKQSKTAVALITKKSASTSRKKQNTDIGLPTRETMRAPMPNSFMDESTGSIKRIMPARRCKSSSFGQSIYN